jgi:competence protein ComEA
MFTRPLSFGALMLGVMLLVSGAALAGPVNINTADAATLSRELKGIGMKRAQAIVDYRTKYGPFKSADDLALIKGIGTGVIQKNRSNVQVTVKPAPAGAATIRNK